MTTQSPRETIATKIATIHASYDARQASLRPLCRKLCTVASIVNDELPTIVNNLGGDDDTAAVETLNEALAHLGDVMTICASRPVAAKLLVESLVKAATDATRAVLSALAQLSSKTSKTSSSKTWAEELEEMVESLQRFKDPAGTTVRASLCSRSSPKRLGSSAKAVVEALVEADVADSVPDAATQLLTLINGDVVGGKLQLTKSDESLLEGCVRLKADLDALSALHIAASSTSTRQQSRTNNTQQSSSAARCEVPDQFRCPITLEIMEDPVFLFTQSGRSFEREALLTWLDFHPTVDPLTNEEHGVLLEYAPNRVLREVIALWLSERGLTLDALKSPSSSKRRPKNGGQGQCDSDDNAVDDEDHVIVDREAQLEARGRALEARFPGIGLDVHHLSTYFDEDTRGRAAVALLKSMEEMEVEEGEPAARAVAEAGGIPLLVVLLAANASRVKEAAATALCRVARRPRDNRPLIVNSRGIAACVKLLDPTRNETDLTRQAAAGVLQHIACYSMNYKVAIANAGAIPHLVNVLGENNQESSDDTKADAARCLWSIAVNDQKKICIANAGAIPHLVRLVSRDDGSISVREAAAGALQNLAANNSDNKASIIAAGAVAPLIRLLSSSTVETARETAAGALQNLAKHNETNKSALIEAGVLPPLIATLADPRASNRSLRTSARAIENLVWSSNDENRKAVIDAGAVPVLCAKLADVTADPEVRTASAEALKVLTPTPKIRSKVARALGSTHYLMTPSERDVENIIAATLRRSRNNNVYHGHHHHHHHRRGGDNNGNNNAAAS